MSTGTKVEELEPSHTVGGNVKWCCCYGNSGVVSQRVKHRVTPESRNSTPRFKPQSTENVCPHKNVHVNVHSGSFITIYPKCGNNPNIHQLMNG